MSKTRQRQRLPDRKSKVTVREVALMADVSESTVSRIMRNQGLVADATRARVMEAVRELGYVPNRIAGSLASLDSHLVGVVVPSLSNIVFPEVLQGISAGLRSSHYQAVISITDYDVNREETLVRSILSWQPAAILITGFDHTMATRKMLDQSGVRVIEMMDIDSAPIDAAVGMSHRRAGLAAGPHLIAVGDGQSSVAMGRGQTAQLLAQSDVDVAVYSNDDMAVGGIFHCMEAGIAVPGALGIFGFNGLEIGRDLPQPLSTIRSNRFMIGQHAIELFLQSPDRPDTPTIIDTGFEVFTGATA